ncbi:MAG: hypothetical protein P9L93_04380 [Candidatus Gorgyraea atricola]|nr:hypothetical protein [Candidatus Gorgyraea atricola]
MDDIRPLKDFVEIKGGFVLWPLMLIVLLLAIAVFLFIYFKKRKKAVELPASPPRPPEDIAMEALKALLEMKLIEQGLIKEYYIRLSDIIRNYIEARFNVFALDRTTWELYQEMRVKKIERKRTDQIRDFLEDCDLVKFAKYIPNKKEIEEVYTSAKEIIKI